MTYLGFALLLAVAIAFSRHERTVWGTARTPFAFVGYPVLGIVLIALVATPAMGFYRIHFPTVLAMALMLGCFALASVVLAGAAGDKGRSTARIESIGGAGQGETDPHRISTLEFVAIGAVLVVLVVPLMLSGQTVEKGELGMGSAVGHVIQVGMAYLLIALSQRGGSIVVRAALVALVLWILAFNQVKYLIALPIAGALLYRWVSGQLSTARLVAIAVAGPLALVVAVYAYFGAAASAADVPLTLSLVGTLARHMVAYLVSGVIGLDRFLETGAAVFIGDQSLRYAFAPFENIVRFAAGAGNYFSVVNPLLVSIHPDGNLDSNVFTLFGSVLYRGGWSAALVIVSAYAGVTYWIWTRWRTSSNALAAAPGSWWMAPLLLAWFDPYFMHLSLIEIMAFLWLRSVLPRLEWRRAARVGERPVA